VVQVSVTQGKNYFVSCCDTRAHRVATRLISIGNPFITSLFITRNLHEDPLKMISTPAVVRFIFNVNRTSSK
jgi:hypothetical protein